MTKFGDPSDAEFVASAFSDVVDGFYIDAGAGHSDTESATKLLYDRGWSGLNLEPGQSLSSFVHRTRDINLPFALSASGGTVSLPASLTSGVGNSAGGSRDVPAITLQRLVKHYAPDRHIHLLRLAMPGAERDVLASVDWRTIRPELIIVEIAGLQAGEGDLILSIEIMKSFDYREMLWSDRSIFFVSEESLHRLLSMERRAVVEASDTAGARRSASSVAATSGAKATDDPQLSTIGTVRSELRRLQMEIGAREVSYGNIFAKIREISDGLAMQIGATSGAQRGNSLEAIVTALAENINRLQDDAASNAQLFERQVADLKVELAQAQRVESGRDEETALLRTRLTAARESRLRLLVVAEQLADARVAQLAADFEGREQGIQSRLAATEARHAGLLQEIDRQTNRASSSEQDAELLRQNGQALRIEMAGIRAASDELTAEFDRDFATFGTSDVNSDVIAELFRSSRWRRLFFFRRRAIVREADRNRDAGRWLDAAKGYAKAFNIRPDRWDLCLQLANMLTEMRAYQWAEFAYRRAAAQAPEEGIIYYHLGHLFEASDRSFRARWAYERAVALCADDHRSAARLREIRERETAQ